MKFSPTGTSISISLGSQALLEQNPEWRLPSNVMTPDLVALGINNYARLRRNDVFIAIRDEGPGLSDEDKTKLFGKFARLSARPSARRRRSAGNSSN